MFEKLVTSFYEVGANTILTKNPANAGDDETFYLHVLRFYIPEISKKKPLKTMAWVLVFSLCRDSSVETRNLKIHYVVFQTIKVTFC